MSKKKWRKLRNFIMKHSMVIFPVVVVVAVAVTVAVALGAGGPDEAEMENLLAMESLTGHALESTEPTQEEPEPGPQPEELELEENTDPALRTLLETYYNARAVGDVDTIRSVSNFLMDTEAIRIQEFSNYVESYSVDEIYTKPGPAEQSWIVYVYTNVIFYGYSEKVPGFNGYYVCTDEEGQLYLNTGETSEDALEYIRTASLQDDVVALNNRVNAEYNELIAGQEELADYISELEREVSIATGEAIAARVASGEEEGSSPSEGGEGQTPAGTSGEETAPSAAEEPMQEGNGEAGEAPMQEGNGEGGEEPSDFRTERIFTAVTTVNVRVSDSELADKLGKLAGGAQIVVKEQMANGWSKVDYEGKEGYIKSEYLTEGNVGTASAEPNPSTENPSGQTGSDTPSSGTAVATINLNLRSAASETAEKLGTVAGGDTVEVLSVSNGWSQVRYNGKVGFVKSEYLR